MLNQFLAAKTIERRAGELLSSYQGKLGCALTLPIRAEHILDVALDEQLKSPLWEPIPEPPGRTILAGLAPQQRLIILNEARKQVILDTAGLLNSLIAHEIGHWTLHVDQALIDHRPLPGFQRELRFTCSPDDSSSWHEKHAHIFMAQLLMPSDLLTLLAAQADLASWRGVYELRQQVGVTITALKIRLHELGFVYIGRDGTFHDSKEEAAGQQRLL